MEKDFKQTRAAPHLDILVRPTPFLLFVKILVIHGILLFGAAIIVWVPQIFSRLVTAEMLANFRIVSLLVVMLLGEIVTLVTLAQWVSEFYIIKSNSMTFRSGVFVKRKQVVMMKRVVEVLMSQSFLGRILNYGNLTLISTQNSEGVLLKKVENPGKYFKILRELTIAHTERQKGRLEKHLERRQDIPVTDLMK